MATNKRGKHKQLIYQIDSNIYLSGYPFKKYYQELKELGITTLVNVTDSALPNKYHYDNYNILYFPIKDNENESLLIPCIKVISMYVNECIKCDAKIKILIHCSAGVSRSVSIIIGYYMLYKKMKLNECIQFIKSKKENINPNVGFMKLLIQFETKLFGVKVNTVDINMYKVDWLVGYYPNSNKDRKYFENMLKTCSEDHLLARDIIRQSLFKKK